MPNVIGYNPHHASSTAMEPGTVLATDARGTDPYVILDPPSICENLVGGRTFYTYTVQLLADGLSGTVGQMTFAASDIVYVRTEYDTEGNQL